MTGEANNVEEFIANEAEETAPNVGYDHDGDFGLALFGSIGSLLLDPTFIRALSADEMSEEMASLVRDARYTELKEKLTPENASFVINNHCFSMTGMEYATYSIDHKLLLLFYFAGCDPNKRAFDGYIQTHSSYYGYEDPVTCPSVRALYDREEQDGFEGHKTTGFPFLRLIHQDESQNVNDPENNEHVQKMAACLWLLERLHESRISIDDETVSTAQTYVTLINPTFDWESEFDLKRELLEETLFHFELSHKSLPDSAFRGVADFAQPVQSLFLDTIRAALKDSVNQFTTEEK